jgi:hypothetical protein
MVGRVALKLSWSDQSAPVESGNVRCTFLARGKYSIFAPTNVTRTPHTQALRPPRPGRL